MFDTVWDLYLSVSTVKKRLSQYLHQCIKRCRTVSLLLHRRRNYCFTTWQTASSQANEHLSSISETAALTTSTQLKLKHMKAFVLVIQEEHKHPSLDAEPSGFFHLHQSIACLYHLVLIVCLFVCLFVREVFLSPSHLSAPLVFLHSCTSDLTFPLYLF